MSRSVPPAAVYLRAGAAVIALLCTAGVLWNLITLLPSPADHRLLGWLLLLFGTPGALCWWFVLRGHVAESRALIQAGCVGAIALGGVGFLAGFIGPIVTTPEANQGPLLGILVTGPLGAALGALLGVFVASRRRRHPPA
jgi:hypothetical protein